MNKSNQLKRKSCWLRFGFTIGLESIRVFPDKSFMPFIPNSFFPSPPSKEDFHFRETLPSILSDADRWKIIGSSWFPREDFSRVCRARLGDDHWTFYDFPRTRGRPTAMKYLWREHSRGTATVKRIHSPPIQFVNASLITLLYDPPVRFWKRSCHQ